MSNTTTKPTSDLSGDNVLRGSFNSEDNSISVNGFLVGKIGRKVEQTISTTTVANDTETFVFSESGTILYSIRVIYTNGTRDILLSAERVA
jgi:hypothetical protein